MDEKDEKIAELTKEVSRLEAENQKLYNALDEINDIARKNI